MINHWKFWGIKVQNDYICGTLYGEKRKVGKLHFFDTLTNKGGFQAIGNRIKDFFDSIDLTFDFTETNDTIRQKIKTYLDMFINEKN